MKARKHILVCFGVFIPIWAGFMCTSTASGQSINIDSAATFSLIVVEINGEPVPGWMETPLVRAGDQLVAEIYVSEELVLTDGAMLDLCEGAVIHMTGSTLANTSTSPEACADLVNLALVFEGGVDDVDPFEVAGEDRGAAAFFASRGNAVLGQRVDNAGHVQRYAGGVLSGEGVGAVSVVG